VWLIAVVLGGLTSLFWFPWGYFGVWFAGYFAITFISLMQILALHEPNSLCARNASEYKSDQTRHTSVQVLSPLSRLNREDNL
jgi:hypothetical protein